MIKIAQQSIYKKFLTGPKNYPVKSLRKKKKAKYFRKRILVKGYNRHNPRFKRVNSYRRNQRFAYQIKLTEYTKITPQQFVNPKKIISPNYEGFPLEDFEGYYESSKKPNSPPETLEDPKVKETKSIPETETPKVDYYFGSANPQTYDIVEKHDKKEKLGVCINMFRYDKNLIKRFNKLEDLDLDIFVDNGSFERFGKLLDQEITPEEYLDKDASDHFFERITNNYEKLLAQSKHPENIMLTIPEVIGSQELTQELQLKYMYKYKEFQEKYHCKLITSLQFNAKGSDWFEELEKGADFIHNNIPKKWRIGIPFGNDFTVIQNKENFKKVEKVFRTKLKGYDAHLFACGSPTKLEKFAFPNEDFISSVDASTIMNWAKNSHYFNQNSGRVIDIRYLTGAWGTPETQEKKRKEFVDASGIPYEKWILSPRMHPEEALGYLEKFDINTDNFTSYYKFK